MLTIFTPMIAAALIVAVLYNVLYRPLKKRRKVDACRDAIERIRREEEEEVRLLAHQLSR
jgi:hypothetical protein